MNPQDEQRIREEFELKRQLQADADAADTVKGCRTLLWLIPLILLVLMWPLILFVINFILA
ncbi:hypothetical protein [Deinococcus misasensis]|uniref:hypothetical protein n=1 Tax=Deinococcus misasensis TaxID=392413 RepID=UPI0005590B58|nr:hypothetical protein [Deinococcus misasensis]